MDVSRARSQALCIKADCHIEAGYLHDDATKAAHQGSHQRRPCWVNSDGGESPAESHSSKDWTNGRYRPALFHILFSSGILQSQSQRLTEASTRIGLHSGSDDDGLSFSWPLIGQLSGFPESHWSILFSCSYLTILLHCATLLHWIHTISIIWLVLDNLD